MKRIIKYATIVLLTLIGLLFWPYFFPYKALSEKLSYDDDASLISFYSTFYSDKSFDELLERLIRNQANLGVLIVTTNYIKKEKKCSLLPSLEERVQYFKKMPKDTTWMIYYSKTYSREFSPEILYGNGDFFQDVEDIKKECEK